MARPAVYDVDWSFMFFLCANNVLVTFIHNVNYFNSHTRDLTNFPVFQEFYTNLTEVEDGDVKQSGPDKRP